MMTLLFHGCKYIKTYCNNQIFIKKGCCNKRFCLNYTIVISDLT